MSGDAKDELELLTLGLAGNRDEFDRFIALQKGWMLRHAEHLLRGSSRVISCSAEDLVQETSRRAWEKRDQFQMPKRAEQCVPSYREYLIRIMDNFFVEQIRKASARYLVLESGLIGPTDTDLGQTQPAAMRTPGRATGDAEAAAQIKMCFNALPPRDRTVLELRYWSDLSYRDIAVIMDMTEDAVHHLLRAARGRMKECMVRSSLWFMPALD